MVTLADDRLPSRGNDMSRTMIKYLFALLLCAGAPLTAQGAPRPEPSVPREHMPPPGLCRIWLNDVPASQQPAPTDCASAVRNRPSNARVIFNDTRKGTPRLPVKSLREEPSPRAEPSRRGRKPDEQKEPQKQDTLSRSR